MSKTDATVISGRLGLSYYSLATAKGSITLETKGLKHSSGLSVRRKWAIELGFKQNAKAELVIAEMERRMAAMLELKEHPTYKNIAIANGFAPAYAEFDGTWKFSALGLIDPGVTCFSNETYKTEEDMWKGCCLEMDLVEPEQQPEGKPQ